MSLKNKYSLFLHKGNKLGWSFILQICKKNDTIQKGTKMSKFEVMSEEDRYDIFIETYRAHLDGKKMESQINFLSKEIIDPTINTPTAHMIKTFLSLILYIVIKVVTNVQINIHKNNVSVKLIQVLVFIILFKI